MLKCQFMDIWKTGFWSKKSRITFLPWRLPIHCCPNRSMCSSKLDLDSDTAFVLNLLHHWHLFCSGGFFYLDAEQCSPQLSLDVLQTNAASRRQCPPLCTSLLLQPRALQRCLVVPSRAGAMAPRAFASLCMSRSSLGERCSSSEAIYCWVPTGHKSLCKLWSKFFLDLCYGVDNLCVLKCINIIIFASATYIAYLENGGKPDKRKPSGGKKSTCFRAWNQKVLTQNLTN